MARTIGVGLIGANPQRGWAMQAHVPAIQAQRGFAIVAVATTLESGAVVSAHLQGGVTGGAER